MKNLDVHTVIKFPLSTEKSLRLMEAENKLVFVVDKRAAKMQIRRAVEELFKVRVVKVNTHIVMGEKRAYVKFHRDYPAIDIATNLKLM